MKILFTTYYHAFQNPGGGETVLLKTREHLIKLGIEVDLFDQWSTKINKYDIVHNFSLLNYRDWDGLKTYCPKLIVTPTAWPSIDYKNVIKEELKAHLKNFLGHNSSEVNVWNALRKVDLFFPTTELESVRLQTRFKLPKKNFEVVYNGVDTPTPPPPHNQFCEQHQLTNYNLFVGRISPLKNVDRIIEASLKLSQKIVVIGKPDKTDHTYADSIFQKYKSNEKVLFIEHLPHQSELLNEAYYGARSVIVASQFETCSLVGLEAGIRKTPVIMTQNGATKEVYKDFVKYVDPNNLESISNAINENWNNSERENLAKHISTHYCWESIAKQIKCSYEKVLKS